MFAEISVNGIPTRTLIDTGSPATIVSLQFAMAIMVAEKDGQTCEQWKVDTLKKLASPEVSLKNYPLNIIAQTTCTFPKGNMLLRRLSWYRRNELLLGTDVLSKLGFVLEKPERIVNLLGRKSLEINLEGPTGTNNGSPERHETRMNNPLNIKPNSNQSPTSSSAGGCQRFDVPPEKSTADAGLNKVKARETGTGSEKNRPEANTHTNTLEEHDSNLTSVLTRIRKAGLRLKPKFAQLSVTYHGHVVSAAGIQTDPEKLRAVKQFADVKGLRSFVGLVLYYRRFVPDFSKVAGPLRALTRKDVPFVWSSECQRSFDRLKELLTNAPVLCYPDFKRPFILETDASRCGLGAVLAQEQADGNVRPIAYASRSLQKHESNYGVTELEGLGVVWAVRHFRPYLYGHRCMVYTNHVALKSLLNTPQPSGKLARWGMALQEMDLTILHRSGKRNVNADVLSRLPLPSAVDEDPTCRLVAAFSGETEETDLPSEQWSDEQLAVVIKYLETGILPVDEKLATRITLTSSLYTLSSTSLLPS